MTGVPTEPELRRQVELVSSTVLELARLEADRLQPAFRRFETATGDLRAALASGDAERVATARRGRDTASADVAEAVSAIGRRAGALDPAQR